MILQSQSLRYEIENYDAYLFFERKEPKAFEKPVNKDDIMKVRLEQYQQQVQMQHY